MNDLLKDIARAGRFRPTASYQRFAYVCGALLIVSGLVHGVVFFVDGGPWKGPVSWRKPIVFGLSFGITLVTLTWIMSFLRPRRATGWIVLGVFSVASLGEVFLISMQKWRGVASHFNEETAFDESVFSMMGLLVALVGLVTVFVAIRSFVPMDAPASLAWAIRTGLVLMLVSQAVGVQMIAKGGNTFGAAGALKVPHALTLHAVQVLPALALGLPLSSSTERRRVEVVALGATGYACLIASTMVQTYDGRRPLDLGVLAGILVLIGLGLLATSALIALRRLAARNTAGSDV
ncbi:MAG: hypothetical protein M3Q98_03430 [Actinomycetota bacterium]|nr:hypothetical protein [Actinomycetota bacterium]